MKQSFDINKLKKRDDGFWKCKTIAGNSVTIYCLDAPDTAYPIHGRLDSDSSINVWNLNGECYFGTFGFGSNLSTDPETLTKWINIYKSKNDAFLSIVYESEADAMCVKYDQTDYIYVCTKSITFEV